MRGLTGSVPWSLDGSAWFRSQEIQEQYQLPWNQNFRVKKKRIVKEELEETIREYLHKF